MNNIYIVRHGQSKGNVDPTEYNRTQDCNIPLTELGHWQAREIGKVLAAKFGNHPLLISSTHKRARQTMDGIERGFSDKRGAIYDPLLVEMEWRTDIDKEFDHSQVKKLFAEQGFHHRFEGGESGADVYQRCRLFWESLFRRQKEGLDHRDVIIVSHGMTIEVLVLALVGIVDPDLTHFCSNYLSNCGYYHLEKKGNDWKIAEKVTKK